MGQPPSSFGGLHLTSMQLEDASTISRGPSGGVGLSKWGKKLNFGICWIKCYTNLLPICATLLLKIQPVLLVSFFYLPSTTRLEMASTVPNSFLILILISPVSLRCNLVRSRRLSPSEISILQWASGMSSSPSLYHWTLHGSWPTNGILKVAFWLCLTTVGFANTSISLALNLGGS